MVRTSEIHNEHVRSEGSRASARRFVLRLFDVHGITKRSKSHHLHFFQRRPSSTILFLRIVSSFRHLFINSHSTSSADARRRVGCFARRRTRCAFRFEATKRTSAGGDERYVRYRKLGMERTMESAASFEDACVGLEEMHVSEGYVEGRR